MSRCHTTLFAKNEESVETVDDRSAYWQFTVEFLSAKRGPFAFRSARKASLVARGLHYLANSLDSLLAHLMHSHHALAEPK